MTDSIPFIQGEVDIKWHPLKGGDGQQVAAIAVQKTTTDAHVERMKRSGMGPTATYSQASALALAAGAPDAMVVHLGPSQAAVVLVRNGTPQAVHQVVAPEGDQGLEDQAEAMARAVEQMEGYDQTLVGSEEGQSLPVVLTGQVPSDGRLEEELRQILQRDILPPSPQVTYPEEFPIAEYATNVGLALLARGRPRTWRGPSGPDVISLNLLSERHIPAPLPLVQVAVYLVLALFAVSALNLTPRINAVSAEAGEKEVELETIERQERMHRIGLGGATALQNQARDIRRQTLAMKSRLETLSEELDVLKTSFDRIEEIIDTTKPLGVSVSNFTPRDDAFTLSGTAPTLDDAIEYADNIRRSPLFANYEVSVRRINAGSPQAAPPPSRPRARVRGQAWTS